MKDLFVEYLQNPGMQSFARFINTYVFDGPVACYFWLSNAINLMILILGYINSRRQFASANAELITKLVPLRTLTPISILMPCYNEEKSIIDSVRSMLNLDYPDIEVLVCNDGSRDGTLKVLIEEFGLIPIKCDATMTLSTQTIKQAYISRTEKRLFVIDKANGGKADALNACVNYSRNPLVCCVDSDSLLDSDGLARVALPFFDMPEQTIAVGGTISIISPGEEGFSRSVPFTWLGMIQALEYLRAFLVGRMGWDYLGCTTIISGAFGLFKKSTLIQVGGYTRGSIGEDMELLLRLHAYCRENQSSYRVCFLPDPVCWTEPPSDFITLGKQRSRWHQGLCDSLWRTRTMFFNPAGGLISWLALPYLLLFEAISPLVEVLSYVVVGIGFVAGISPWATFFLLITVTKISGVVLNLCALIIDQLTFSRYTSRSDLSKLILGCILEQLIFRQIHLFWRMRGMVRWAQGSHSWGDMKRSGFRKPPSTPQKTTNPGAKKAA